MGGLVGWLAGAPQQASTYGSYYQNAANEIANQYGSPAAQMFGKEQAASLRPQFQMQQDQLTGALAGQGIAHSGAGRAAFGNLAADQASTLAGAVAPLYQQGEQQYGGIIGAMPGAEVQGYQGAISDFYQALQAAGSAAAMFSGGGGGGAPTPGAVAGAANQAAGSYFGTPGSPGSMSIPAMPQPQPVSIAPYYPSGGTSGGYVYGDQTDPGSLYS